MEFILDEDQALRNLLVGIEVSDQKADASGTPRKVGVWFGQPDLEIRDQSYPYITIDLVDISEDPRRAMRGLARPEYMRPDGVTDDTWAVDYPTPVNIDYQITTYARQPRHDRTILAALLASRLPLRFGTLLPNDGTVRRLDVLDVAKRDQVENGKRMFVNIFTIRVSSEIPTSTLRTYGQVDSVHITPPAPADGATVTISGITPPPFDGITTTITAPTGTP